MPADMWLANLPTYLTFFGGAVLLAIMARDARRYRRRTRGTPLRGRRPDERHGDPRHPH